jgi:hypothetical protein
MIVASLAAAAIATACDWNRPGHDPFTGDVPRAVQRYKDIPQPVRDALQKRMATRAYDEIATITRDSITGKHAYAPELTQMHFGAGKVCDTVSREKWKPAMIERALIYCESGHCVAVPTVCRNVSRVARLPPAPAVPPTSAVDVPSIIAEPAPPVDAVATAPAAEVPQPGSFAFDAGTEPPVTVAVSYPVPVPVYSPAPLPVPPLSPVPEPGAALLFSFGAACVAWATRKRKV